MAEFDPNSLTWKVFVNVVREKHGHELVIDNEVRATSNADGRCVRCGLLFHGPSRLRNGWAPEYMAPSRREVFLRCRGTRSRA
jgi:hypothetical protein